jgi:hypothetical protein
VVHITATFDSVDDDSERASHVENIASVSHVLCYLSSVFYRIHPQTSVFVAVQAAMGGAEYDGKAE